MCSLLIIKSFFLRKKSDVNINQTSVYQLWYLIIYDVLLLTLNLPEFHSWIIDRIVEILKLESEQLVDVSNIVDGMDPGSKFEVLAFYTFYVWKCVMIWRYVPHYRPSCGSPSVNSQHKRPILLSLDGRFTAVKLDKRLNIFIPYLDSSYRGPGEIILKSDGISE